MQTAIYRTNGAFHGNALFNFENNLIAGQLFHVLANLCGRLPSHGTRVCVSTNVTVQLNPCRLYKWRVCIKF